LRRAIYLIPIGRITALEFLNSPFDSHRVEHGEVGSRVSGVGIEQRAVPIEQDNTRTD
jgi:hypothetical protein